MCVLFELFFLPLQRDLKCIFMTTLTLQVSNPSLLPSLKKILGALDGVTIAKPARRSKVSELEGIPNKETISAIEEAKSGKDAGEVCLESVDKFIDSILN